MTITVTGQKPVVLDPVHTISCAGAYDPLPTVRATIVDPLSSPLQPGGQVGIVDDHGNDLSAEIAPTLEKCLDETAQPQAEQSMKQLLGQTLSYFDQQTPLPINELFAAQAGRKHKLPAPGPSVIYTARDDIIPAAKSLLAGTGDSEEFFASLAYAYHPNTLGFWFQSQTEFEQFQIWADQQVQMASAHLPAETSRLMGEFGKLSLNQLTESLVLRADQRDGNEEFSFARLLIHLLMTYTQQQSSTMTVGALPFTLEELFCPRSVVLVNLEAHAHARPSTIASEWKIINHALSTGVRVVSHQRLSKLTTLPRATARAQARAQQMQNRSGPGNRSATVAFRKQPPSKIDLLQSITRVLKKMGKVNRSQNVFRHSKSSFLKPNRRNPDDFNKPGRITSVSYMPDLHVYIDTSGSISEANYQDAIMMLINLARKLNVNLYFNSFSHQLSQETLLRVENKSVQQIWKEFRRVPKVSGGTEYTQVWDYINDSPARRRRLSLILTDFEWSPPNRRVDHPGNLYYAPCSAMDWTTISANAQNFAQSMHHIEPAINQRLLGLIT